MDRLPCFAATRWLLICLLAAFLASLHSAGRGATEPQLDPKSGLEWYSTIEAGYRAGVQAKKKILLLVLSPDSKTAQYLDRLIVENKDIQQILKAEFVVIRVDFTSHATQMYALHIFKAGTIVLYGPDGNAIRKIDQSLSPQDFMAELGHPVRPAAAPVGAAQPAPGGKAAPAAAVPRGALLVDDFRTRNIALNLIGGYWGTFCAVRPQITLSIVTDGANPVLYVKGTLPQIPGETTSYGGFYTELTPGHARTVDLRKYKALQFRARSNNPGTFYQVRLDTPRMAQLDLTRLYFTPTKEWQTFSLPLADFKTGVQDINMLTIESEWKVGAKVDLLIDDIMFVP